MNRTSFLCESAGTGYIKARPLSAASGQGPWVSSEDRLAVAGSKKDRTSDGKSYLWDGTVRIDISDWQYRCRRTAQRLFWAAALLRRTSVLACGQNLGAGGIHFCRAFESPKGGGGPLAAGTQKERHLLLADVFLFGARGGSRTRTPLRALAPEASESTNSTTRANGWRRAVLLSASDMLPLGKEFVNTFFLLDKKVFPAYNK